MIHQLSTEASAYFAVLISDKLGALPIKIERKTFHGAIPNRQRARYV